MKFKDYKAVGIMIKKVVKIMLLRRPANKS